MLPARAPPTNLRHAAMSMIGAAFLFAVMSALVKLAARSLPNAMIVFLRCLLSLVLLLPWYLRKSAPSLRTAHLRGHVLRGLAGMGAMYCFFIAIARLRLAEALLLNYSLPLFIPIVERVWLGARTSPRIFRPLALGLVGLLFILKPGTSIFQPIALIGVLSALLGAVAQVGVRELTRTEPVANIVLYFGLVSSLVSCGPAVASWHAPEAASWLVILGIGASGMAAQLLLTRAYAHAPAAEVGPFIYTSVIFAAFFDWLVFKRLPDGFAFAGAAFVVIAGVTALRNDTSKRAQTAELD